MSLSILLVVHTSRLPEQRNKSRPILLFALQIGSLIPTESINAFYNNKVVLVNVVLNGTVVQQHFAVVIFRVKVSCITSVDSINLWLLTRMVSAIL